LRFQREEGSEAQKPGAKALLLQGRRLGVVPPGLGHVTIGQQQTLPVDQEAGAVVLHGVWRSLALQPQGDRTVLPAFRLSSLADLDAKRTVTALPALSDWASGDSLLFLGSAPPPPVGVFVTLPNRALILRR
jgi:hypothetical protein